MPRASKKLQEEMAADQAFHKTDKQQEQLRSKYQASIQSIEADINRIKLEHEESQQARQTEHIAKLRNLIERKTHVESEIQNVLSKLGTALEQVTQEMRVVLEGKRDDLVATADNLDQLDFHVEIVDLKEEAHLNDKPDARVDVVDCVGENSDGVGVDAGDEHGHRHGLGHVHNERMEAVVEGVGCVNDHDAGSDDGVL